MDSIVSKSCHHLQPNPLFNVIALDAIETCDDCLFFDTTAIEQRLRISSTKPGEDGDKNPAHPFHSRNHSTVSYGTRSGPDAAAALRDRLPVCQPFRPPLLVRLLSRCRLCRHVFAGHSAGNLLVVLRISETVVIEPYAFCARSPSCCGWTATWPHPRRRLR